MIRNTFSRKKTWTFGAIVALLTITFILLSTTTSHPSTSIERIWLSHRTNTPNQLVINWETNHPGNSVVRYGASSRYENEVKIEEKTRLHHVEIPLNGKAMTYHYQVSTAGVYSDDFTFKSYPTDILRVAIAANWQKTPNLDALKRDNIHLLLSAGDNIGDLWPSCGFYNRTCTRSFSKLIDTYPELFRSIPFMPVLGNHDRQTFPNPKAAKDWLTRLNIRPYDVEAIAFRTFFELPDDEWKWHLDFPDFDLRFVGLDLNHIYDEGTYLQSSHSYKAGGPQFQWYRSLMTGSKPAIVITVHNEGSTIIREKEGSAWHELFRRGTLSITGFGYFLERAEQDNFSYYNTSLRGKGEKLPDPNSVFFKSEDNYVLLTLDRGTKTVKVALKDLNGTVLYEMEHATNGLPISPRG